MNQNESDNQKKRFKVDLGEGQVGYAVQVNEYCPHFKDSWMKNFIEFFDNKKDQVFNEKCHVCQNEKENWICYQCQEILCSRYINSHMADHYQKNDDHCVSLSLIDGSTWCNKCDDYIYNEVIKNFSLEFTKIVELKEKSKEDKDDVNNLVDKFQKLDTNEQEENKQNETFQKTEKKEKFTRQQFIEGIQDHKFQKICFLVGAGISVSAGIPDFRSPKYGIYHQLQKFDLPNPVAVFDLNYFKKNPIPFYMVSKSINSEDAQPTINHVFIKKIYEQGLLNFICSQNIDSLELKNGIPQELCIQAHGHYRTAHCISCQKEASMEEFKKCVQDLTIMKCKDCQEGLVKPDIVFFGEQLPKEFFSCIKKLLQSDLVIIMGTSLQVYPFSQLVASIGQNTPIVLINREDSVKGFLPKDRYLFIEGDLDENVTQIFKDLKWEIPKIEKKPLQDLQM